MSLSLFLWICLYIFVFLSWVESIFVSSWVSLCLFEFEYVWFIYKFKCLFKLSKEYKRGVCLSLYVIYYIFSTAFKALPLEFRCLVVVCDLLIIYPLSGFICSWSRIINFGIRFKVSNVSYHGCYGNFLSLILVSNWCGG